MANPMADIPKMLDFIKMKQLQPELVTTKVGDWADSASALLDRTTKVMITRHPLKLLGGCERYALFYG